MAAMVPARIAPVDSLRGFALFGLFAVHMIEYFELYWMSPPAAPGPIHQIIFGLFGGKAYALLALCFGFSFHILFDRARAKGEDFAGRFAWRMILLFLFGVVHGEIYRGDIITVLAVFGLLLIPIDRVKSNRLLLVLALICFAQPMLIARVVAANAGAAWGLANPGYYTDPAMAVYAKGSFPEMLRANLWDGQANKWSFYVETGRVFQMFGLFLMGTLAGRSGFFEPARLRGWTIPIFTGLAFVALVVTYLLQDYLRFTFGQEPGIGTYLPALASAWFELSATALWVFAFLWAWTGPIGKLQQLFVAPGRLTLTLYLGQSFVFVPLFYGFGFGAYAWIGQGPALALGIVAFALQAWGAHWWLKRYHYGPLEWLWRAGTYRTADIAFRKAAPAEAD